MTQVLAVEFPCCLRRLKPTCVRWKKIALELPQVSKFVLDPAWRLNVRRGFKTKLNYTMIYVGGELKDFPPI